MMPAVCAEDATDDTNVLVAEHFTRSAWWWQQSAVFPHSLADL